MSTAASLIDPRVHDAHVMRRAGADLLGLDAAGIEASVRKRFGVHLSLVKPAVND